MSSSADDISQHADALLNCPVCMEKLRHSAKILPCQHTFCLPCLRRCHNAGQVTSFRLSMLSCPICRKSCPVPAAGLDALPNDFRVKQFRELVERMQRQQDGDEHGDVQLVKCSVCQFRGSTQRAEIFCTTCDKNFCHRCADSHRNNPVFRKHVTQPLDSDADDERRTADDDRCRNHSEKLGYFCEQCERAICTVCVLAGHQQHHVVDMDDAGDIQKQILRRRVDDVRSRADKVDGQRKQLRDVEKAKKNALDECRAHIQQLADEACRLVLRRKHDLLLDLDRQAEAERGELDDVETKLQQSVEHLRAACIDIDNTISTSSLDYRQFLQLSSRIRTATSQPQVAADDVMRRINCFRYGPRLEKDLSVELGSIGKQELLEEFQSTTSTSGTSRGQTLDDPKPDVAERSDGHASRVEVTADLQSDVSMRSTVSACPATVDSKMTPGDDILWTTSLTDCRGVCYLSSGELVAALCTGASVGDRGASKLRAFDTRGDVARHLIGSVVARPWSLSYEPSTDSLAVTDLDSTAVKILKSTLTIRDLAAWRGAGVIRPLAVGSCRQTSHYILTDSATSSSSRVSIHAQAASRIVKVRAIIDEHLSPAVNYVTVDSHDRIILSDSENGEIFVYSVEGKRLADFRCDGDKRMCPQGVATDAEDNIFVAEQDLNGGGRLVKYSADGQLMDVVVQWTDDEPWGVAYDASQCALAVATDSMLTVYRA